MNAPTTRETADHAELARLAEAATPGEWRVAEDNNPFADGRHVFAKGLDGTDFVVLNLKTDHTFVTATSREQQQRNALFAAAANPATVLSLLSEIAALRGERDGLRNRVSCLERLGGEQSTRVMEQATRAKDAERQRDELRSEGQKFADFIIQMNAPDQGECLTEDERLMFAVACRFRAFLANQGADQ